MAISLPTLPAVAEQARTIYAQHYACSQSVLLAFAPYYDLPADLAARLSAPFGGGIARSGSYCGAVCGAVMVLGLQYGNRTGEEPDRKEKAYAVVQEFLRRFKARHGELTCRGLLGCDIGVPAELQHARDLGLFKTACPELVYSAAEIAAQLLDQNR